MAYSADVHRLQEDAKQQVLSQHLAAQLSYYAAQPTSTRKRLGRVVISGETSLSFRVPHARVYRSLEIITSINPHDMRRLLEETMSQDDTDPFTYKIFRTKDMASRPGKIYSIRVLDDEHEYGWIKMQATRGVDVEYEDTEEMQIKNPLVESRATTTIKLIDVGKYLAEKIVSVFG